MKPPAKHEVPPAVFKFLKERVPESVRGIAAVELMGMLEAHRNDKVRFAAIEAAKKMHVRMRYNKWSCYAAGFGVGILVSTLIHLFISPLF